MIHSKRISYLIVLFFIIVTALQAQKPDALLNQAARYEQEGRMDEARKVLEGLYGSEPDNVVFQARLKRLYLRMQAFQPLIHMLDEEIQRNPGNPTPKIEKAQALHRMGRQEEALRLWRSVIESNPKNRHAVQQVASVMTAERLFEEAIDVYRNGRETLNDPGAWSVQLAGLYAAVQEYGEAAREYLRMLKERPNQAVYVEAQILRLPDTEKAGDAILAVLEETVRNDPSNPMLLKLLSRAHLRWGDVRTAYNWTLRRENAMSGDQAGAAALLEFADWAREPGQLDYAEKAYLEILDRYPDHPSHNQIWFLLGRDYESRGKFDAALAALDSVVRHADENAPAAQALMLSGKILRDRKADYPAAEQAFQRLLRSHPRTAEAGRAHLELGIVQLLENRPDRAERSFILNLQTAATYTPLWLEANLRLAETAYYRGAFDTALTVLKDLSQPGLDTELFRHPEMNDALGLRLLIQTHAERSPGALRLLSEAQLRIFQNRTGDAVRILDELIRLHPDERVTAHGLFERAMIRNRRHQEMESLADLDTLLSRFPESLIADQALYESAQVCERMGDEHAAMQRYERFLVEYPDSPHIEAVRKRIRHLEGGRA